MSDSKVPVRIWAADGATEVLLVDGRFAVIGRGLGCLEADLAPGIYRARARLGDQETQRLFSVDPGAASQDLHLDRLEFASPMPLSHTSTSHEYHMGAIYRAAGAQGVTARLGTGGGLIVFLRDPGVAYRGLDDANLATYAEGYRSLILSDWRGGMARPLADLAELHPADGYLIAHLELDPGCYALSGPEWGQERRYLPLVVSRDWCLQAFVMMVEGAGGGLTRRPDFDGAALVLDRPGQSFDHQRPDLRVLEAARLALSRGHSLPRGPVLDTLLCGKFEDPMMGLLAAHLVLLGKQPDLDLLDTVIRNTGCLIGDDHPDLIALAWKAASLRTVGVTAAQTDAFLARLQAPPMLQLSWRYLNEAARTRPGSTIAESGPFRIAGHLVASSVWLNWVAGGTPEAPPWVDPATARTQPGEAEAVPMTPSAPSVEDLGRGSLPDTVLAHLGLSGIIGGLVAGGLSWGLRHIRDRSVPDEGEEDRTDRPPVAAASTLDWGRIRDLVQGGDWNAVAVALIHELVERIDWVTVVGVLKRNASALADEAPLSQAQRCLLLALKSLREQFDEGDLSQATIAEALAGLNLPLAALRRDLERVTELVARLGQTNLGGRP